MRLFKALCGDSPKYKTIWAPIHVNRPLNIEGTVKSAKYFANISQTRSYLINNISIVFFPSRMSDVFDIFLHRVTKIKENYELE